MQVTPILSIPPMDDNIFAAFSYAGAPTKGATPSGGAHLSKVGNDRKGGGYNDASAFAARAGSAASHAVVASRRIRGNVKHEYATEGLGVSALDSDLLEDSENSRNAPGIQTCRPRHGTVENIEKTEAVTEEEPRAPPQVMYAIQVKEENQAKGEIQVKKENQVEVEAVISEVNKKRPSHSNSSREEEICEEIEDFGGGSGLSGRSADAGVLEVKKVTMTKRQNTKLTKQSRCGGSSQVRPPPPHWEKALQSIRTMRTGRDAPVDLLGPAQLVDPNADSETQKFHVLVAAMISSQTRDAVTAAAMKRLHALSGGLTVKHLVESDFSTEKLEELLKPVGFYRSSCPTSSRSVIKFRVLFQDRYFPGERNEYSCGLPAVVVGRRRHGCVAVTPKARDQFEILLTKVAVRNVTRQKAKQLKSMAEMLLKPPYYGCVPRTLDELMKLPGVGPKVGLLVLWVGFGMGEVGLIVDTNVRRVCCRLGWAPEGSSAELVRHELESWLPKDLWAEASFLLVGFGQQICKPIGPNCKECQLQNFCPSAFKCGKKVITKQI